MKINTIIKNLMLLFNFIAVCVKDENSPTPSLISVTVPSQTVQDASYLTLPQMQVSTLLLSYDTTFYPLVVLEFIRQTTTVTLH